MNISSQAIDQMAIVTYNDSTSFMSDGRNKTKQCVLKGNLMPYHSENFNFLKLKNEQQF